MNRQILLVALTAAVLSSCTTAYRSGQTPDDVYFSPARPQDEYVQVNDDDDKYRYDDEYYDDRYLRMKVHNRTRWEYLNDWYYYDRYSYRYNYYYGSYYNPYTSWNYYYNPYCPNYVVVYNPKVQPATVSVTKPRNFSLSGYTNTNLNNRNSAVKVAPATTKSAGRPVYNNSNSSGLSNTLNKIFSGSNNSNNSSYSPPTRSYTPSSSGNSGSSGSSSGGSSSGGGVSRPSRGGN
jgi:uncharacterized membrane protein YgcG